MEKFLSFVLTVAIIFALVWGVMYEDDFEKALDMLEVNNAYQAYILLYSEKDDNEEAKELLKNFKIVHTKEVRVDSDGDTVTETWEYDSDGNKIKYSYLADDGRTRTETWEYDSRGNVTRHVNEYSVVYNYSYTYDSNDNIIKKVTKYTEQWSNSKETVITETYTYDAEGLLLSTEETSSDGSKNTCYYTYDSNGNLLKREDSYTRTTNTYDSDGNLIKSVWYRFSDDYTSTDEYKYDSKGNMVEWVYNGSNVTTLSYDDDGNLVKVEDEKRITTYSYDEYGVMTERRDTYIDGELENEVYTITYSDYLYFYFPDGIPE